MVSVFFFMLSLPLAPSFYRLFYGERQYNMFMKRLIRQGM